MLNCTWHLWKANMKPPKAWHLPNMLRWTYLYSFWSWNKLIVGLQMTFLIAFFPIRVCTFWLKFPSGVINNKLALVQIMAWCQTDEKTLSAAMTVYCCIYPSLSLDEVTQLKKARKFADEILQKYFFFVFWFKLFLISSGHQAGNISIPVQDIPTRTKWLSFWIWRGLIQGNFLNIFFFSIFTNFT